MKNLQSARILLVGICCSLAALPALGQVTPDQMAEMLLTSARKAHGEKNYAFAAARFREFLGKFGGHKLANDARYGLALTLLDAPEKNYNEAAELLRGLAGAKDFAEQPLALYHLALALRAQGVEELIIAAAKPGEAPQRQNNARQRFEQAAQQFALALQTFTQRAPKPPAADQMLSAEHEWAARARCDLAEMQLRLSKPKEAQTAAEPFLKDPLLARSKYRDLGRYHYGFASLLLKDNAAAQKTLALLAPFADADFGLHARYLLARTHHLADERAEASHHYEGVLQDYATRKADAAKMLQQPQTFKNDPAIRARLEALIKNAPPDEVARGTFYLGVLQYEAGRFAEAKQRFAEFPKLYPQSPLRAGAELRLGFCQVQLKEFADAAKTLTPLIDRDPKLSDQVLLWLGKAQAGAAPDPAANAAAHQQTLNTAINTLRQAYERAQRLGDQDPDARSRRGEVLLEIADLQQALKQHREAANACNQILAEKLLAEREEEVMLRLAQALHLAGDHNESDKACQRLQEKFPKSTLLPAALFTMAENSYFRILQAEKAAPAPERAKVLAALADETSKRLQTVIDKYPEYPKVQLARYTLGLVHYRKGDLDSAQKTLSAIPAPERGGELAAVPYLIADCILRQTPSTVPEDALAAGKMEEQLKTAAELLDGFVSGNPKDASAADALLKLGLCQQRLAGLLAQPPEKQKMLAAARAVYERILKDFAAHAAAPQAIFERAKVLAQAGDSGGALNELRRFTTDPLRQSGVAPIAVLQLATMLRAQNKSAEAADIVGKGREYHEPKLQSHPERASWIALLRYHHGVALREAGKLPEARAVFDLVVKQAVGRPEASEAALRLGQTLKEEGEQRLEAGRKVFVSAKKPEEKVQAQKLFDDGFRSVREAVAFLEGHADQLKKNDALGDLRARMLYEAAWGTRILSEPEVQAARTALAHEIVKKLGPQAAKFPLPEVPIDKVPLQPSEKKARGLYRTLIDAHAESPIAVEARFELAELLAQRHDHDEALKLLGDVLDKEPSPELTAKVRLRLGSIHAAKGNLKGALAQFDVVANNPKSPLAGWAHYRAGEALLAGQQYAEATKRLVLFRDQGQFQNIAGLSDRALLRLGHALAAQQQWDASRQAHERLVNAFGGSAWADEARYGIAWAWQQQKNHDQAVNVYSQVTARTATELAAKAQLQIGMCRAEQKRWLDAAHAFLVVPTTYDYPELAAAARLEAAKAYAELKHVEQATRQLERIQRDYAGTPWADAAKELQGKVK
jgi:TolA-binding protein